MIETLGASDTFEIRDRRGGEWGWFPKSIVEDLSLHPSAKLLYMCFALHANTNERCWPSRARLAQLSGLGERTITRAVQQLELAGYLVAGRERGKQTHYALTIPATSAKMTLVPNVSKSSAKSDTKLVPNNTTNNNKEQELLTRENEIEENPNKPRPEFLNQFRGELAEKGIIPARKVRP